MLLLHVISLKNHLDLGHSPVRSMDEAHLLVEAGPEQDPRSAQGVPRPRGRTFQAGGVHAMMMQPHFRRATWAAWIVLITEGGLWCRVSLGHMFLLHDEHHNVR